MSMVGSSVVLSALGQFLLAILLCGSTSDMNGELGGPRESVLFVSLCTVSRVAGDSMLSTRRYMVVIVVK
jgi:hypothetical protein